MGAQRMAKFGRGGMIAEKNFRKLAESWGIELEDGSPSKAGDFTIFPNFLAEVKSTSSPAFNFSDHSAHGTRQWEKLVAKFEKFPWVVIVYPVWYSNPGEWRYFDFPKEPKPLRFKEGKNVDELFSIIKKAQDEFASRLISMSPTLYEPSLRSVNPRQMTESSRKLARNRRKIPVTSRRP